MRCSEEPPIVVDMEPGFGPRRRPLLITCGISPKFGGASDAFGATHIFNAAHLFVSTHRLERKDPAPRKEVAHV